MSVLVLFDLFQEIGILLVHQLNDALGDQGHAVTLAGGQPLDDRAGDHVGDFAQAHGIGLPLFGDQGQSSPCALADAHRQMPRLAAHGHDNVPTHRGQRVVHQVGDDHRPHLPRGLKAKSRHALRKGQVVVDGLGYVHRAQIVAHLLRSCAHLVGRRGRVIPANGHQVGDPDLDQGLDGRLEVLRGLGRVGARGLENNAPTAMDAADVVDRQVTNLGLAADQVLEPLLEPFYRKPVVDGPDGHRVDHAVDPRRWPSTGQNAYCFELVCCWHAFLLKITDLLISQARGSVKPGSGQ